MNIARYKKQLFCIGAIFSRAYGCVMRFRRRLYKNHTLPQYKLPVPVISVGNITLGGTGKTPITMAIADILMKNGKKVAVVSRGYKGKAGKGPVLVSDGMKILTNVSTSGDEAMMIASKVSGLMVVVGSDRKAGGELAIQHGAEVIILDDGFQHLKLHRDIDIICISAREPFGNNKIFPGGDLREPLDALYDATAMIITNMDCLDKEGCQGLIKTLNQFTPYAPFVSRTVIDKITLLDGSLLDNKMIEAKSVVAFCGIGHPESFFNTLLKSGLNVTGKRAFPDHHHYRQRDLSALYEATKTQGAHALVTTAKDAIKLHGLDILCPVWVVETRLVIEPDITQLFREVSKNATF